VKSKPRKLLLLLGAFLVLYVASFAVLASRGGYLPVASGSFRPRYLGYLASADTWIWQPRYGNFYPFRNASGQEIRMADSIGCFYTLLICVHQRIFRPSIPFLRADVSPIQPRPRFPTRREIHPIAQAFVAEAERDFHIMWDDPSTWPKPPESK
jgi:4-amino-4-deoxy-L-arabinose transferase-like glycosyltransferase